MNKEHTAGITQRFLQICAEAIQEGYINNKKEFAESVGEHQQNLSQMDKGKRAPTLDQIVNACRKYGYSANWIMLNQGSKKMGRDAAKGTAITIEQRMNILETEVSKISRNMQRIKSITADKPNRKRLNGRRIAQGTKKGTVVR